MLIGFVGFLQQYVRLRDLIPTKLSVVARNASIPSKMSSNSFVSKQPTEYNSGSHVVQIYTLFICVVNPTGLDTIKLQIVYPHTHHVNEHGNIQDLKRPYAEYKRTSI